MFSGLSEEGTMTVPVKRFASPCVLWFALCRCKRSGYRKYRRSVT
jgi:hypothetical protein